MCVCLLGVFLVCCAVPDSDSIFLFTTISRSLGSMKRVPGGQIPSHVNRRKKQHKITSTKPPLRGWWVMVIKIQDAMVISVHLAHVLELEVVLLSLVRFFFLFFTVHSFTQSVTPFRSKTKTRIMQAGRPTTTQKKEEECVRTAKTDPCDKRW